MCMLRKVVLLILIAFALPQAYSLCPKDVYYATPGKNLEVITLSSFDLDPNAKGVQSSISVAPGQHVRGVLSWKFGNYATGEARVNLFGNWSKAEVAKLYSGSALPNQSVSVEFSFFAPRKPGSYRLTAVFAFDTSFASNSEASNLCSPQQCSSLGRCAVAFAFAEVKVLNTTPALYAEITSPKPGEVFTTGESIAINATIVPENATVAVLINGTQTAETLPYNWNTSGLPPGEYPIEVVVSLGNQSFKASRRVRLVNLSQAGLEFYEILLPRSPAQLHATSQNLIAVAGNEVYILKPTGEMLASITLKTSPMIAASEEYSLVAEKNLLSMYRGTQKVWNASIDKNTELLAASPRGSSVIAGNTLYLFNTAGALLWTKQLEFKPASLAISNESIAIAGNDTLYLYTYDGALVWNTSFEKTILAVTMDEDVVFALLKDEIHAFAKGEHLWNITLEQNMSSLHSARGYLLAASQESVELYDAEQGRLIWRYYPEKGVKYATISPDASRIFIISGEKILAVPLFEERWTSLPSRNKAAVIAALAIFAALLFFLLKRSKPAKPQAQVTEPREALRTLRVRVRSSKSSLPLSGALVKSGNIEATTDAEGFATLRIKPEATTISVEKKGFKPAFKKFTPESVVDRLEVELEPALRLGREEEERLEELRRSLDEAYERVAEHDPCLPAYFRSIGYGIIDGIEVLALTSEFSDSKAHVDALISAAEKAVPMLCEAMQDWKNVALYQASPKQKAEACGAPPLPLEETVAFLLGKLTKDELEREIFEVDRKITSLIKEISTYPLASLWQISRKLFEKGGRRSHLEARAFFALSHYLLLCIEDMLRNDEVLSRLKASII